MRILRDHPAGLFAVLMALAIQVFAPNWAALVMRSAASPELAAAEICHADGSGNDRRDGPQPAHQPACPVCQAFAAVQTLLASPSLPTTAPVLALRRLRRMPVRRCRIRSTTIRPRARAPPYS